MIRAHVTCETIKSNGLRGGLTLDKIIRMICSTPHGEQNPQRATEARDALATVTRDLLRKDMQRKYKKKLTTTAKSKPDREIPENMLAYDRTQDLVQGKHGHNHYTN